MELYIGGYAQGKYEHVRKEFPDAEVWNEFHLYVKEQLGLGMSAWQIEESVFERIDASPQIKILCDEIGCGIVPMEKADRLWREETGRLLCKIASRADKVVRFVCGIPQRIK